jgi:hypothetical protein
MEACCADPANRDKQPIPPEQREHTRRQTGSMGASS